MIMQVNSEDLIFDVSHSRVCEKTVVHLTLPALLAQLDVHPTGPARPAMSNEQLSSRILC